MLDMAFAPDQAEDLVPMTAFRQSVEAMIPALRRYARALARDADSADDLVQDTLVRALRSERLFLGGDIRSWLYTILTNLNKNRRRSLARRPQFMPLLDNNPDASGTEAEGRDIARALATLVEEQRSVLLLVMLEGLSYREVADIQGVPIGTVMSRLARARAHVKASLEGERTTLRRGKGWGGGEAVFIGEFRIGKDRGGDKYPTKHSPHPKRAACLRR